MNQKTIRGNMGMAAQIKQKYPRKMGGTRGMHAENSQLLQQFLQNFEKRMEQKLKNEMVNIIESRIKRIASQSALGVTRAESDNSSLYEIFNYSAKQILSRAADIIKSAF